jgi:hypothetical protein
MEYFFVRAALLALLGKENFLRKDLLSDAIFF